MTPSEMAARINEEIIMKGLREECAIAEEAKEVLDALWLRVQADKLRIRELMGRGDPIDR